PRAARGAHAGVARGAAAARQAPPALLGGAPGGRLGRVDARAGREVRGQSAQREPPAHSARGGAELRPALVVDLRDVLQLEAGAALRLRPQPQLDPGDPPTELPGGGEAPGRVAALDRPAGVALELI